MARVLVIKTGGAWHGEGSKTHTSLTSQHNHTAVARTIRDAGHDVLCCGRITGDLGHGLVQCSWEITPAHGLEANARRIDAWIRAVEGWRPDVLVNVSGSEQTCQTPDNPRGTEIMDAGWRFGWPLFRLMPRLKLPRIIVVTDVRCYPRDQEMTWMPEAVPAAVLSQQTVTMHRRVLDRRFAIHAVYAGIEKLRTQWTEPLLEPDARTYDCLAVAHAHRTDSRIKKHRDDVWSWILSSTAPRVTVFGDGWEESPCRGRIDYRGVSTDVMAELGRARCGPLVPMGYGWVSPKYCEYALAGCVPLPYGRGPEALTYDADGQVIPLDDETRFASPAELDALVERAKDRYWRYNQIEIARERAKADPRLMLECIEHFARGGRPVPAYGGYENV